MSAHYSKREVKEQLSRLYRERDSLMLTVWEEDFIEDIYMKVYAHGVEGLSESQKAKVTDIYLRRMDE